MKYFIQIYSNPSSRQAWESFSAEEQASGYEYYQRISDELAASGEFGNIDEVTSPDDNLQAVFQYLVK